MKRDIKVSGGATIIAPQPNKAIEREFQRVMTYIVKTMATRFENNTFKKLNKGTIEKFEDSLCTSVNFDNKKFKFKDAQVGNYANVFLSLSKKARRMILRQFSDERINDIVTDLLLKAKDKNAKTFYGRLEIVSGISSEELIKTEGLTPATNALILETAEWATRLRDDTLNIFVANSLRGMALGLGLDQVIEDFGILEHNKITNAKMVARTQIGTFNSLLTKIRAQNVGITKARWRTSEDERVRHSHDVRNNKEFDLDKGLYSSVDGKWLLPGVDYNCRCDYELIIDSE